MSSHDKLLGSLRVLQKCEELRREEQRRRTLDTRMGFTKSDDVMRVIHNLGRNKCLYGSEAEKLWNTYEVLNAEETLRKHRERNYHNYF